MGIDFMETDNISVTLNMNPIFQRATKCCSRILFIASIYFEEHSINRLLPLILSILAISFTAFHLLFSRLSPLSIASCILSVAMPSFVIALEISVKMGLASFS